MSTDTKTTNETKLGIVFGVCSPPLEDQISAQKCHITSKEGEYWQKWADSITLLSVHNLLTPTETHNARKRLMKKIQTGVEAQ